MAQLLKQKIMTIAVTWVVLTVCASGQTGTFIGAGNDDNITVTASSSQGESTPAKTIDGSGLNDPYFAASRFLGQATLGAGYDEILAVKNIGYEAWIDDQFTKPATLILPKMNQVWDQVYAETGDPDLFGPWAVHFNYAWWDVNMQNQDLLRQRVAFALSEIMVVSINSDLGSWGEALSAYYDLLLTHSFGNYKDLLMDVTRSPAMGYYLSHLNNYPEDLENNVHPDENYAREIMQLFTIGLYNLNMDGSRVLDLNGNPVPSYNNNDIKQLARVFTGLGPGSSLPDIMYCPDNPEFGLSIYCTNRTVPMQMYPEFHQPGSKTFLGHTITGSSSYTQTTAMAEVQDAVNFLFNHPNTAPFVSLRLIQRLVKSNPSPGYVLRVAQKFANNGNGVRGDMKAVIKAILLDDEARNGTYMSSPSAGKLREPLIRYTQTGRALPTETDRDRYWNNGFSYLNSTGQQVLAAPTVFNFFPPDFQPVGDISDQNMVAPEFKIHNTSTSVGYINEVDTWVWWALMWSWQGDENNPDNVRIQQNELAALATDEERLINYLDMRLSHGQLTDQTRGILRTALNDLYWTWDNTWIRHRVRLATYLMLISPDYNVVK